MNLSKFVPKQVHIPYVGALYELSGRVFYFVSIAGYVLTTRVQYYNPGDPWIRESFGSYITFAVSLFVFAMLMGVIVWVALIPSQNKFLQEQAVIEGRSPMYEKLCDMDERLKNIEKKV